MARGRMLSTLTGRDEKLSALSVTSLCLYLMTIPHLDRDGLIDGRPAVLVGMAAPLRGEFRDDAHVLIMEWVTAGVVTRYNGEREPVLLFHGFRRHQQGMRYDRELPSVYPPPPGSVRCPVHGLVWAEEVDDHAECSSRPTTRASRARGPDHIRTTSGPPPDHRRTTAGCGPAEVEDQTEVEVEELSDLSDLFGGGGDRSTTTTRSAGAPKATLSRKSPWQIDDYDADQMRALIVDAWPHWGVLGWLGLPATLQRYDAEDLRRLLAWCYYASQCMPDAQRDKLHNMPGWITYQMDHGDWPLLSGEQESDMGCQLVRRWKSENQYLRVWDEKAGVYVDDRRDVEAGDAQ